MYAGTGRSEPWSPPMNEDSVMSPLTYPNWSEWSRSQAPEAWDHSLQHEDNSLALPRTYVNEPWYEGNEDGQSKPPQHANDEVVPQYDNQVSVICVR